ncbi:MAG: type II toxin-antitoxin system prevent-host-death family antitoxin [Actinomycetota bacterium]|nr:type II toxin-antitoxin system prevent-host-death family antitoxin [Actinomycetota bacterium]MDQ6944838.1 type II toxin-antitoxin system prevent-host-death family antitoxin [Actinomycetota bacterium]
MLRNHGGDVVDRVVWGEHLTVTRDGKPVAQLVPLGKPPLSVETLRQR